MAKKGSKQKRYSTEFKLSVIMDMREHHMSYKETVRKYWDVNKGQEHNYTKQIQLWERIFLEEGAAEANLTQVVKEVAHRSLTKR